MEHTSFSLIQRIQQMLTWVRFIVYLHEYLCSKANPSLLDGSYVSLVYDNISAH